MLTLLPCVRMTVVTVTPRSRPTVRNARTTLFTSQPATTRIVTPLMKLFPTAHAGRRRVKRSALAVESVRRSGVERAFRPLHRQVARGPRFEHTRRIEGLGGMHAGSRARPVRHEGGPDARAARPQVPRRRRR